MSYIRGKKGHFLKMSGDNRSIILRSAVHQTHADVIVSIFRENTFPAQQISGKLDGYSTT